MLPAGTFLCGRGAPVIFGGYCSNQDFLSELGGLKAGAEARMAAWPGGRTAVLKVVAGAQE